MIHFDLVSSSGIKFSDDVYEVLIPTKGGVIAVLEDHMPLMSAGQPGIISVRKQPGDSNQQMEEFAVSGGVMEVDGKSLRFLSDDVTVSEDVSEQEAEAAVAKARQLVEGADNRRALEDAQNALQHSQARLHVARLKKRRHM